MLSSKLTKCTHFLVLSAQRALIDCDSYDNPEALAVAARRQRKKPKMDSGLEAAVEPTQGPLSIGATCNPELLDSDMLDPTEAS